VVENIREDGVELVTVGKLAPSLTEYKSSPPVFVERKKEEK
jgi:hypothetical protein